MSPTRATALRSRLPCVIGILSALTGLVVAALPLVYFWSTPLANLRIYASAGFGGLWVVAGLSLVLLVVFLAGVTERIDIATVAGIALGVGVMLLLVATIWAIDVGQPAIRAISPDDWFRTHRWYVLGISTLPIAVSLWMAVRYELL